MRIALVAVWLLLAVAGATQSSPPASVQRSEFWCPMHPNERSPVAATCPICKMTMVPIPPPRIGEYRMDVEQIPSRLGRGAAGLRLVFRDPVTALPVTTLETVHERPVHVFIVNRTLEYFAHVHPEAAAAGTYEVRHAIPAGEYMVVADFLPRGGSPQTLQRAVVTPGATGLSKDVVQLKKDVLVQTGQGIRAYLQADDVTAGKNGHLTFSLADAAAGAPATDLEPYLGAPAHLFIASADLTEATHVHPEETKERGSQLIFDVTLPKAGGYRLWLQIQRNGNVITLPFTLLVSSQGPASPSGGTAEALRR